MRLHHFVAVICLLQALAMCFVLSPIKALAYPATMGAPAVWWILDLNTAWLSLRCFEASNALRCMQLTSETFQFSKVFAVRFGICLVAVASGLLVFRKVCTKLSQDL